MKQIHLLTKSRLGQLPNFEHIKVVCIVIFYVSLIQSSEDEQTP